MKLLRNVLLFSAIALCAVVLVIRFVPGLRCGFIAPETAKSNDSAKQWLHFWPGQFDWNARSQEWQPVVSSKIDAAESALAKTPWVALSDAEALDFTGENKPKEAIVGHPYLVRTVVAAKYKNLEKFRVDVLARSRNTDIWIVSGAIGSGCVPMRRHPIVVWLDNPPGEVFITFSVAE